MHYAYLENCVAVIWLAVYPIYFTVFWLFIFWTDIQVAPYDKAYKNVKSAQWFSYLDNVKALTVYWKNVWHLSFGELQIERDYS